MEALNTHLLRLFDWLLWTTIQGSVLIVLIVLIQKLLPRRLPVHWHYLLWLLLLVRLAFPWLPESRISIFNLVPRSVQQGRIIESFSQSRSTDGMGYYMRGRSLSDRKTADEPETVSVRFARALPALWLAGTVLIAGYVCVRSITMWRTVKRERPITDQKILDLLEDCKMQMHIGTILGVVVSDRIKSPALFGFIRPRLLLPQGMLEAFGLEELRYVFIHELAHLKQRDIYLGWLIALLHVAHWFNPLMWFAFSRIRADREIACDRLAISTMEPDEPPQYGRTIVSLLESFSQTRYLPSVAGILEDACQVERRIKMIADYKKTSRTRWAGATLLLAALACVVLTNAYVAKADFEFSEPVNLRSVIPVIDPSHESIDCLSYDGLEIYVESDRPGGYGDMDLWVLRRGSIDKDWGPPENLGPLVNSAQGENAVSITADGLTLYFGSGRPGGYGEYDIYVATRATQNDLWGEVVNIGPQVNTSAVDMCPQISPDGLELYLSSTIPGGYGGSDIYVARRTTQNALWGKPVNLGPVVNSAYNDHNATLSADGLLLLFDDSGKARSGGYGAGDMWMSRRATLSDPWQSPVNLGPMVNSTARDAGPRISPDGHMLYFFTFSNETWENWQASILPIVDFNGDGSIDTVDLLMLIDHWGQNEPLYDIGPTPYGDGIVNIKDLEVFMSYWEKENMPGEEL